jgi:hypothetical protein
MAKLLLQRKQSKKSTLKSTCRLKNTNVSTAPVEATVVTVVAEVIETDAVAVMVGVIDAAAAIAEIDVDATSF